MSVISSIPLTENKERKEKVQIKKIKAKNDIHILTVCRRIRMEKRYRINRRRKIEIINFNFIQIDNDSKNEIALTSPTDYSCFVEILLEVYGP